MVAQAETKKPDTTRGISYGYHQPDEAVHKCFGSLNLTDRTARIKDKALSLGASLVGICWTDSAWVLNNSALQKHGGADRFRWCITIAVAMDREAHRVVPSPEARAATSKGYAEMARIAPALGEFLAGKGYAAVSSGNGDTLSIPPMVAAGLGSLGRNGMTITNEYGPCIRICKVFTDMPLELDTPTDTLYDACTHCSNCSQTCPAGAIESGDQPRGDRWQIDIGKCRDYWRSSSPGCSVCVAKCPMMWRG